MSCATSFWKIDFDPLVAAQDITSPWENNAALQVAPAEILEVAPAEILASWKNDVDLLRLGHSGTCRMSLNTECTISYILQSVSLISSSYFPVSLC